MGNFSNGMLEGKGSVQYASRTLYIGTFRNGLKHGNGTLSYANGNKYTGDFIADKFDGIGRL